MIGLPSGSLQEPTVQLFQTAGYAVYVVTDSQAQRRDIELGIIKDDRVHVTQGLNPGETLIIDGHRLVAPGQKVNIVSGND